MLALSKELLEKIAAEAPWAQWAAQEPSGWISVFEHRPVAKTNPARWSHLPSRGMSIAKIPVSTPWQDTLVHLSNLITPRNANVSLLSELYQVLGALDADPKVLDQVLAAINNEPLPYDTLLPYTVSASKNL